MFLWLLRRLNFAAMLVYACWLGCGGKSPQTSVSAADLKSRLKPLVQVGVYVTYQPETQVLVIGNAQIERHLWLGRNTAPIQTSSCIYKPSNEDYLNAPGDEFHWQVGTMAFSGGSPLLKYETHQITPVGDGGKRVSIQLTHGTAEEERFRVYVHYEIYPEQPMMQKWLTFENLGPSTFFVEDLAIESLPLLGDEQLEARRCDLSKWTDTPDAQVVFYNPFSQRGVVLGSDAPGILKAYRRAPTQIRLNAELRVPAMQSVDTPRVWTLLFGAPSAPIESVVRSLCLPRKVDAPTIQWAGRAADWRGDATASFVVFDYDWEEEALSTLIGAARRVQGLGEGEAARGVGVRLPIAALRRAVLDRPDWQLTPAPVGAPEGTETSERLVYCVLSSYGYYLTRAVKQLIEQTEAEMLIFDGAMLGLPEHTAKGCDAFGHEHYTRAESIRLIYQWLFAFADHLHETYPSLQLGITSEAYGVPQPDTACLAHFDLFFKDAMRLP